MKGLTIFILLAMMTIGVYAHDGSHDEKHDHKMNHSNHEQISTKDVVQQRSDIRIKAKGIVCSFCAQGIKKAFKAHPSIQKFVFDSKFNMIDLYLKKDMTLSDEEIEKIVTDSGYLVESILRKSSQKTISGETNDNH